jgi:hypothetical protein
VDLLDARAIIEGPISRSTRFALAARRSWIDAWLGAAGGKSVAVAPVYYDYQAILEHDVSKNVIARVTAFGSDDRMKLLFAAPEASDPANGGDIGLHESFFRVQGRVDARLSDDVHWVNEIAWGVNQQTFNQNDYAADVAFQMTQVRSDFRYRLSDALAFVAGADVLFGTYDITLKVPPETEAGEAAGPVFARPAPGLSGTGSIERPAAYALAEVRPIPRLLFTPGLRVDYMSDTARWTADPRVSARFDLRTGPAPPR